MVQIMPSTLAATIEPPSPTNTRDPMSNKHPNPNDWNRGYTVGTGRSPIMLWLGMTFVVAVLGISGYVYFTS